MNHEQLERMSKGKGFIAALDQSGGSTPKALKAYGIEESAYSGEDEMFDLVHAMKTRIITNQSFSSEKVLTASPAAMAPGSVQRRRGQRA